MLNDVTDDSWSFTVLAVTVGKLRGTVYRRRQRLDLVG